MTANVETGIFVMSNPGEDPAASETSDDVVAVATIGTEALPNVVTGNDGGIIILDAFVMNRFRLEGENTLSGNGSFEAIQAWFDLARATELDGDPIAGATVRVYAGFMKPGVDEPFYEGVSDESGVAGPDGFTMADVFSWGVIPEFIIVSDEAGMPRRVDATFHKILIETSENESWRYQYPWDGYNAKSGCTMTTGVCRYQVAEDAIGGEPVELSQASGIHADALLSAHMCIYPGGATSAGCQRNGPAFRTFKVFSPAACQGTDQDPVTCPAVFMLHGGGGYAAQVQEQTDWNNKAKGAEFNVVYPQGIDPDDTGGTWNAEHCCGAALSLDSPDVLFDGQLVDALTGGLDYELSDTTVRLSLDSSRIYLAGFSNGAMLAHRIAAKYPGCFAAVAPVAGTIGGQDEDQTELHVPAPPGQPIPILMMHGLEDAHVPYYGGSSSGVFPGLPNPRPRVDISQQDSIAYWIAANGASTTATTIHEDSYYIQTENSALSGGAPVELVTVIDPGPTPLPLGADLPYGYAGHAWPGGDCSSFFPTTNICLHGPPDPLGDPPAPRNHVHANDLIWDFFSATENPSAWSPCWCGHPGTPNCVR